MSEFKFSCPDCGQRIAATDEYVGYQIKCPACQGDIVVPGNPDIKSSIATPVLPGAPPPPVPPAKTRLSVSALKSPAAESSSSALMSEVGATALQAYKNQKEKKSYTGLISGLAAVAIIAAAAFFCRDWLSAKWASFHSPSNVELSVAPPAAANPPSAPAPDMTAAQIWQKVTDVYKSLPSFTSTGKLTSIMDMSQVNAALAANGPVTVAADLSVKMGRPDNFRVDLELAQGAAKMTTTGWSAGKGAFFQDSISQKRAKLASPDLFYDNVNKGVSVGVGDIIRLFQNDVHGGLGNAGAILSRTNDDTLDGQPCYVLAGTVRFQNVLIWVNCKTFLIPQTQVVLDGESSVVGMDDAKIKEQLASMNNGQPVTAAQIAQVKMLSKMKGTFTDTYQNIQTNATLALADFEPPPPAAAAPAPPAAGSPAPGGRANTQGIGGSGPGGIPGRMRRAGGGG